MRGALSPASASGHLPEYGFHHSTVGTARFDQCRGNFLAEALADVINREHHDRHIQLILGPQSPPPATAEGAPAFGRPWADEGVGHAIALLELLFAEPFFDQVLGVSLAEYPATGRLVIVTNWGSDVVWGSPLAVDATHRGEVKVARRLANLRELQSRYTRIDAGQRRVDVFGPSVEIEIVPGRAP